MTSSTSSTSSISLSSFDSILSLLYSESKTDAQGNSQIKQKNVILDSSYDEESQSSQTHLKNPPKAYSSQVLDIPLVLTTLDSFCAESGLTASFPSDFTIEMKQKITDILSNIKAFPTNSGIVIYSDSKLKPKFCIQPQAVGDPRIYYLADEYLSNGSSGLINKGHIIHDCIEKPGLNKVVWKVAHNSETNPSIENEYKMLAYIHSDGQVPGIQFKLHSLCYLRSGLVAHIGYRYDTDLLDILNDSDHEFNRIYKVNHENAFSIIYQLLYGAATLEKMGIHHGDIKLDNIFLYKQDGIWYLHLGDFGGARFTKSMCKASTLDQAFHTITTNYCALFYQRKAIDAWRKKNFDQCFQYTSSYDVFALGCCLYTIFAGEMPYQMDQQGYPILHPKPRNLKQKLDCLPEKVQELILEMIEGENEKPLSAMDFILRLENIYKEFKDLQKNIA